VGESYPREQNPGGFVQCSLRRVRQGENRRKGDRGVCRAVSEDPKHLEVNSRKKKGKKRNRAESSFVSRWDLNIPIVEGLGKNTKSSANPRRKKSSRRKTLGVLGPQSEGNPPLAKKGTGA